LAIGALLWFVVFVAGALGVAYVGVRFDLPRDRRFLALGMALAATLVAGALAHRVRRVIDVTELRRASLPPVAARALGQLSGSLRLEVWLDRDDARRRQLEADTLAKLRIARPDLEVRTPLDERPAPAEGEREPGYGRIVVETSGGRRETHSTSRKEIVTL